MNTTEILNNGEPNNQAFSQDNINESDFIYSQEVIRKMSDYFDEKVVGHLSYYFLRINKITLIYIVM